MIQFLAGFGVGAVSVIALLFAAAVQMHNKREGSDASTTDS